jgi:hypothetical protein
MKKFLFLFLLASSFELAYSQQSCPKWGPYVNALHLDDSAELVMADVMTPASGMAPYTYACTVQFGIGKSGGYCGIQNNNGYREHFRPLNNIFSIWNFPNKIQILCVYKNPLTFVGGFGGEGTGLHSHADFGWIPGHWYTNVVRRWYNGGDRTLVGYWIYDQSAKTWTHYVTFSVPQADAMLHGNIAGFLENFADSRKASRTSCYKSYWLLNVYDQWEHPDTLLARAGAGAWSASKLGEDGVSVTSCGTKDGPANGYRVAVKTGNHPDIGAPVVYDAGAYYDREAKEVFVDWSLLRSSTPQLSYKIALYGNQDMAGKPLAEASGTDPDKTIASLPVSGIRLQQQDYYITVSIKDIFDQKSKVRTVVLRELKP